MPKRRGLGVVQAFGGDIYIEWWHGSPLWAIEHQARAMLLGRYYNPVHHDYRSLVPDIDGPPLDADTLEVMTWTDPMLAKLFKAENGLTLFQCNAVQDAASRGAIRYPERTWCL